MQLSNTIYDVKLDLTAHVCVCVFFFHHGGPDYTRIDCILSFLPQLFLHFFVSPASETAGPGARGSEPEPSAVALLLRVCEDPRGSDGLDAGGRVGVGRWMGRWVGGFAGGWVGG